MLATQSAQVGMFDAAVVMGPLPEGSFYALLAEHGDRVVRDADFVECYSSRMGRPSIPPSLLAKVLLLQHRTGVSDEDAMECVRWDLRWKAALNLPVACGVSEPLIERPGFLTQSWGLWGGVWLG